MASSSSTDRKRLRADPVRSKTSLIEGPLSSYERFQFAEAVEARCRRLDVSLRKVLQEVGVASSDFYSWRNPGTRSASLTYGECRRICQALQIQPPQHGRAKGAVYLAHGDHEEYIDNVLQRWYRQGRNRKALDPTAQILALIYVRWDSADLAPRLVLQGQSNRFPGSITIDYLPGVRYELALSCASEPAIAQLRRYVKLPDSDNWAASPVMEFQFSGAASIWLETILVKQRQRSDVRVKAAGQKRAREVQRLERAVRSALQQHHEQSIVRGD